MSETPDDPAPHHDEADAHESEEPMPGESWANVALAIFIAIFFGAGVYSAAHALAEHEEGAAGAEHAGGHEEHAGTTAHPKEGPSPEAPSGHGEGPTHEPRGAPEEKPGAPAEAPHEAPHEGK